MACPKVISLSGVHCISIFYYHFQTLNREGGGVIQETGLLSFLMISCFVVLCLTTFMLNGNCSKHDVFTIRTFITVLVFFLITPVIVILKNENIALHSKKCVTSFECVKTVLDVFLALNSKFRIRNQVQIMQEPLHKVIV